MKKMFYSLAMLQLIASSALSAQEDKVDLPPPTDGLMQTLTMMAVALLFFYFILWRPEQKRRKEMEKQRAELKAGDSVTAMGIVGTVVKIQDHTVILKMYDGSKIEVVKGAITDINLTADDSKKTDITKIDSK